MIKECSPKVIESPITTRKKGVTALKLKIGNFQVRSVCLGEKDAYENGVLTLCKEKAITYLKDCDDHITDLDIVIANPGEDVDKMAYLNDINRDKFNKKMPKTFRDVETPNFTGDNAIALLEVEGLVASVDGLDAMLKAAEVRLVHT